MIEGDEVGKLFRKKNLWPVGLRFEIHPVPPVRTSDIVNASRASVPLKTEQHPIAAYFRQL
jgi:hypothetical protein